MGLKKKSDEEKSSEELEKTKDDLEGVEEELEAIDDDLERILKFRETKLGIIRDTDDLFIQLRTAILKRETCELKIKLHPEMEKEQKQKIKKINQEMSLLCQKIQGPLALAESNHCSYCGALIAKSRHCPMCGAYRDVKPEFQKVTSK